MDETKTCEDHKARRRTTSVLLEVKETKRCSTLVKPLILAIALLIICCLILLNLYLIERSRPKAAAADKRVESPSRSSAPEKYYGGSCWTAECLHAASGKSVGKSPGKSDLFSCHCKKNLPNVSHTNLSNPCFINLILEASILEQ